jgi:hypothetical protein
MGWTAMRAAFRIRGIMKMPLHQGIANGATPRCRNISRVEGSFLNEAGLFPSLTVVSNKPLFESGAMWHKCLNSNNNECDKE